MGGERTMLFVSAGCKVTGIDIRDMRKPEFIGKFNFIMADGRKLLFESQAFDVVVSFDVIEHVDDEDLLLDEAYRVLQKDGIFILGTPNRNRLSHKLRKMLRRKIRYPLKLEENCIHVREYTMSELIELVENAGFKKIRDEYVWFGLVGIGGFKCFPPLFDRWFQYLVIFAVRP